MPPSLWFAACSNPRARANGSAHFGQNEIALREVARETRGAEPRIYSDGPSSERLYVITLGALCIADAPEAQQGRSANGGSCPNFEP
jgi:hypothetical protein